MARNRTLGSFRVKGKKQRKPLLPACVPKPVRITRRAHSWISPPSRSRTAILTIAAGAGDANADNFARTFTATLWYAAGTLVAVFLGLLALPRRARPQDTVAGLPAAE